MMIGKMTEEELRAICCHGTEEKIFYLAGRSAGLNKNEEVRFDPPREVRKVRVYSADEGWVEICAGPRFLGVYAERSHLPDGNERWIVLDCPGGEYVRT